MFKKFEWVSIDIFTQLLKIRLQKFSNFVDIKCVRRNVENRYSKMPLTYELVSKSVRSDSRKLSIILRKSDKDFRLSF